MILKRRVNDITEFGRTVYYRFKLNYNYLVSNDLLEKVIFIGRLFQYRRLTKN